ncbi:hypothetical protein KPH14_000849 [Odynerus spinipes]|uniref:Uncharacterized protein n=1 Tax=Odynerus spinipes TaxID=1348599 RepID=A0AAD9RDI8_9HYME|nr:hypothetical protein KPH14_000849 [Odynerus spinipes]
MARNTTDAIYADLANSPANIKSTVINKLTAEEVNELVDKENEIIDTVNEMLEGFKEITDEEIVSIAKNNINQLFNIVIHTSGNKSIDGLAMPDLYLPIKYIRRAYSTNPSDNIYITFEYSEGSDDGDATQ